MNSRTGPPRPRHRCRRLWTPGLPSSISATWPPSGKRSRNTPSLRCNKTSSEAVSGKRDNGSDAERGTQQSASQYVAEEVHAEDDARESDAHCEKIKRPLQCGIEVAHDQRDRKRGHGVTGREGKLIRRQN